LFGLDSDATPERVAPENRFVTRKVPAGAWDAFAANSLDRQDLSSENFPEVRGYYATRVPRLPRRLEWLGTWIMNVADQPAAVWWAVRQKSLHPGIRKGIEWGLHNRPDTPNPVILTAWRYLLEARERIDDESEHKWYEKWYELKSEIGRKGWDAAAVRRFITITHPYVKADPALRSAPVPPKGDAELRLWDLVRLQVECPVPPDDAGIPDEWLEPVIRRLRKNLELAVELHVELDQTHWIHIGPIVPDIRPDIDQYQRVHGLSGYAIKFAGLFERLMDLDISKAQREFAAWPTDDDIVFCRLRLWAGGKPKLASPDAFCRIVAGLSDDVFWSSYHQRDFLLVLASRWKELSEKSRKGIEDRLLRGPAKRDGEDDASYGERRVWAILGRLQWLADNNCEFSFNLEEEITRRRPLAPKWEPEFAKHAAESLEGRGGMVITDTGHAILLREPIGAILSKARELSGRTEGNFLKERDPFAGLCADRPVRAICALSWAARHNEYPEWAWRTFLNSPSRKNDKPKLSALVAERLCRLPDEALAKLLQPATWWFREAAKTLSNQYPVLFDKAMSRLIEAMNIEPSGARSNQVSTTRGRDWVTDAINSPAGHIAEAIFADVRLAAFHGAVDPSADWLGKLARLLALEGEPRRHTIATIASEQPCWLYHVVSDWTERHLLAILDADDEEDRECFWDGFLRNPNAGSPALYLRLKPGFSALVKERRPPREAHLHSLAVFALSGWITPGGTKEKRLISNDEFRDLLLRGGDDFRSHILWQIGRELRNKKKDDQKDWSAWTLELLQDVWPRQRAVKNPTTSARLCELLISDAEAFGKLVDVASPFLTKITKDIGLHFHPGADGNDIAKKHPKRLLALLYAILPDEASDWPYGISEELEKIGVADSRLLSDPRFRELRRRWNAK